MSMRRAVLALVLAATAAVTAAGSVPQATSADGSAFLCVNQVGYPAAAAKRAYVMSNVDEA
jgi:hypothetical protein